MSAERLPLLRYNQEAVDFIALHQAGRTPSLCPLPEGEGVVAIVPDQPLRPDIHTHWQRDPQDLSRIVFADPGGEPVTSATPYLLSPGEAKTLEHIINR